MKERLQTHLFDLPEMPVDRAEAEFYSTGEILAR